MALHAGRLCYSSTWLLRGAFLPLMWHVCLGPMPAAKVMRPVCNCVGSDALYACWDRCMEGMINRQVCPHLFQYSSVYCSRLRLPACLNRAAWPACNDSMALLAIRQLDSSRRHKANQMRVAGQEQQLGVK